MSTRLSPLGVAFLELEEADQSAHVHIGWALIFDPPSKAERPSPERLRSRSGLGAGDQTPHCFDRRGRRGLSVRVL